jgi:hypothetical protein
MPANARVEKMRIFRPKDAPTRLQSHYGEGGELSFLLRFCGSNFEVSARWL